MANRTAATPATGMISWSALASIGGSILQSRNASCQAPCATGGKYRRGGLHGELGHPAPRAYGLEPFRPRGVYRLALAGVKPAGRTRNPSRTRCESTAPE